MNLLTLNTALGRLALFGNIDGGNHTAVGHALVCVWCAARDSNPALRFGRPSCRQQHLQRDFQLPARYSPDMKPTLRLSLHSFPRAILARQAHPGRITAVEDRIRELAEARKELADGPRN